MSSPLVLCSPAESLGLRGCHVFCSPRSIPLTHSKFHCTRETGFRSFFHFCSRIHSPQQPCSSTMLQNTTVLSDAQNKSLASPLCILHRSPAIQSLPISVFHPRSTRSRLAAFQSFLLSLASQLPKTYSCSPCCLAPPAALKAVLPVGFY